MNFDEVFTEKLKLDRKLSHYYFSSSIKSAIKLKYSKPPFWDDNVLRFGKCFIAVKIRIGANLLIISQYLDIV